MFRTIACVCSHVAEERALERGVDRKKCAVGGGALGKLGSVGMASASQWIAFRKWKWIAIAMG